MRFMSVPWVANRSQTIAPSHNQEVALTPSRDFTHCPQFYWCSHVVFILESVTVRTRAISISLQAPHCSLITRPPLSATSPSPIPGNR